MKQKISIQNLAQKKTKQPKLGEYDLAVITHFLHNQDDTGKKHYQTDTQKAVANLITNYHDLFHTADAEEIMSAFHTEAFDIPFAPNTNAKFKYIDLFAGIGGFKLALHNLGGKCTYSNEWDTNAQKTYRANYGEIPFGDITKEKAKDYIPEGFDILCGGFPCQAFSIAGHRKGFTDTRGTLFFDIQQIAEKHRPKVLFLENVKNLVSHDKGKTFKIILEILEQKLGYKVNYKVLNSMTHANIPHNRERIFIIAFDPEQVPDWKKFQFPEPIPLEKTIHDLLLQEKQDDYYYYKPEHQYYPELNKSITSKDTIYQWRRVYVRENKSNACPTLTANMGTGGHNVPIIRDSYGIRKLTPRECFRFQGFPDNYVLPSYVSKGKLYMQAGNSVTMPLIQRIGEKILEVLPTK